MVGMESFTRGYLKMGKRLLSRSFIICWGLMNTQFRNEFNNLMRAQHQKFRILLEFSASNTCRVEALTSIFLVHGNWGKRLQAKMSSHASEQVKTCIGIALRCVEVDRVKRPTIAEIVNELNKVDTAKSSPIGQIVNFYAEIHGTTLFFFRTCCRANKGVCLPPTVLAEK